MKILDDIQDVFNEHKLKPIVLPEDCTNVYVYLKKYPEKKGEFHSEKNDRYFLKKYRNHIVKGHYGFSIGDPIIPEWCEILDEILQICVDVDPEFGICQIKIKYGGIRFYVESDIIEDISDIERLISNTLYDKALIY